MTKSQSKAETPVMAFDPGATTGFAMLLPNGKTLLTQAIFVDDLDGWIRFLRMLQKGRVEVIIEVGPQLRHNSPVTRRVEAKLREAFPNARLVPPGQWKSHPATRATARQYATKHEKDAVGIARWFLANGDQRDKNADQCDTPRTHSNST